MTPTGTENGAVHEPAYGASVNGAAHNAPLEQGWEETPMDGSGDGSGSILGEIDEATGFLAQSLYDYLGKAAFPPNKGYVMAAVMRLGLFCLTLEMRESPDIFQKIEDAIRNNEQATLQSMLPVQCQVVIAAAYGSMGDNAFRQNHNFAIWSRDSTLPKLHMRLRGMPSSLMQNLQQKLAERDMAAGDSDDDDDSKRKGDKDADDPTD